MVNYRAKKHDCISSLAESFGLLRESIWLHPKNAELRRLRKNMNVLKEGDVVFIPELRKHQEAVPAEARHRFKRVGVPEKLHLVILDEFGQPRPNVGYRISVDSEERTGSTDEAGELVEPIPSGVVQVTLSIEETVSNDDEALLCPAVEYEVLVGALDPLDFDDALLARLRNLGYSVGDLWPVEDEFAVGELVRFQIDNELEPTGTLDDPTRAALADVYET